MGGGTLDEECMHGCVCMHACMPMPHEHGGETWDQVWTYLLTYSLTYFSTCVSL